jgi:large subunit ribosomal protein L25
MFELQVKERSKKEKADTLRLSGLLPSIFYGPKEEAQPIAIDATAFGKVWKEAGGSSIVVLKGIGEDKEALIHDVDVHPVTGIPIHADLYVIERGKKITVSVPIEFIGEAPAEKAGHIISKALHEIEIEVRPSELPQHFEVDISSLSEVGDHITIGDITLPPSAELLQEKDEIIASVKEYIEVKDESPETVPAEEAEGAEGEEASTEGAPKEQEAGEGEKGKEE